MLHHKSFSDPQNRQKYHPPLLTVLLGQTKAQLKLLESIHDSPTITHLLDWMTHLQVSSVL